jgi:hypothetical protein
MKNKFSIIIFYMLCSTVISSAQQSIIGLWKPSQIIIDSGVIINLNIAEITKHAKKVYLKKYDVTELDSDAVAEIDVEAKQVYKTITEVRIQFYDNNKYTTNANGENQSGTYVIDYELKKLIMNPENGESDIKYFDLTTTTLMLKDDSNFSMKFIKSEN